MILTIDIGNSNLVAVIYDEDEKVIKRSRVETIKVDVRSYYLRWLKNVFINLDKEQIENYIVSCVSVHIIDDIMAVLKEFFGFEGYLIKSTGIPGFKANIDNPQELGTDIIATTIGASKKYKLPIILVDMGSANKVSYINEKGEFEGVTIAPGIGVSSNSMITTISHLPNFAYQVPSTSIGKNTIISLQAGLMFGAIGSVEYVANRIEKELNVKATKVLTGGYAKILYCHMPEYVFDPDILNEGILEIYKRYNKKENS